eukprot:TRINITY_DN14988_c0_g1_i1.p1 TRINITY_DN14988_c0_g1~~TRINITY_DN14988_c0_g1_i1.p1  ORF type:complete len:298 (-),score=47.31 TRINITY_DN14988_c0_g1_i1:70-921(-)
MAPSHLVAFAGGGSAVGDTAGLRVLSWLAPTQAPFELSRSRCSASSSCHFGEEGLSESTAFGATAAGLGRSLRRGMEIRSVSAFLDGPWLPRATASQPRFPSALDVPAPWAPPGLAAMARKRPDDGYWTHAEAPPVTEFGLAGAYQQLRSAARHGVERIGNFFSGEQSPSMAGDPSADIDDDGDVGDAADDLSNFQDLRVGPGGMPMELFRHPADAYGVPSALPAARGALPRVVGEPSLGRQGFGTFALEETTTLCEGGHCRTVTRRMVPRSLNADAAAIDGQ